MATSRDEASEGCMIPGESTSETRDRVIATGVLRGEDPQPPAGSQPVAAVRGRILGSKRRSPKERDLLLVDWEERALVARFIRLIRSNYWLSHFVKNLLRLDADTPEMVPISEVKT